jgi:hypothetical protein
MVRPIFTELTLFLLPFVVYALVLWGTREGVLHPQAWAPARLAWLAIVALLLMLGSLVVFAEFGGAPPGSTYVPAHVDGGKLTPGQTR